MNTIGLQQNIMFLTYEFIEFSLHFKIVPLDILWMNILIFFSKNIIYS